MGQIHSDLINSIVQDSHYLHNPTPPNGDDTDITPRPGHLLSDVHEFVKDLPAIMDAAKNAPSVGIDDRKLLLEKGLVFISQSGEVELSKKLEELVIDLLYKDLPHPPNGYLSLPGNLVTHANNQHITYAFRSADGSNYNVLQPSLGMAGMPYARTVPSTHALPPSFLPDAGLVFDTLLKRDEFTPHPGGVSSLFFAFADLVIHSLFNTDPKDRTINNTSSYLDLSPLYGNSEKDVDSVRRKDGTGRLWEDVFADKRILFMPPAACALLVLLSRNHNYIANKILSINEAGTYKNPATLDEKTRIEQDDEIFHRSRLVNCGFFMQIILGDYVGAILGLVRDGSPWRLKVLEPLRELDHQIAPRGEGNVVSIEFNLMYRWHATLSEPDTEWIEAKFGKMFSGKDLGKLSPRDFGAFYKKVETEPADVKTWTFSELKRDADGRFDDASLAKILQDATESYASAFKARGIPEALRVVEMMSIEQGRKWGTCSLNEFRRFMGLKPYSTFAQWNSDPEIYTAAETLYEDIENLELYVGMQAEEAKKPGPGAGLCPGYTISRAILADAVCLTRGDRFLTTGFTPQNFTAWGYQDCQFVDDDGSFGGMLTKLLFRTLPKFYPAGSAYAHFPFMVPEAMEKAAEGLNIAQEYIWTRPVPESFQPNPTFVMKQAENLHMERLENLTGVCKVDGRLLDGILSSGIDIKRWSEDFFRIANQLVADRSADNTISKIKCIDIVRSVVNLVPVQWLENEMGLCNDECSHQSRFEKFANIAHYLYLNTLPEQEFILRKRAQESSRPLNEHIICKLRQNTKQPAPLFRSFGESPEHTSLFSVICSWGALNGYSKEVLAAALLDDIIGTAALYSRAVIWIADYLLDHKPHVIESLISNDFRHDDKSMSQCIQDALNIVDEGGIRHGLMNEKFMNATAPSILRAIFSLGHVRRAPGRSGRLSSFTEDNQGTSSSKISYLTSEGRVSPWPSSLFVQYGDVP